MITTKEAVYEFKMESYTVPAPAAEMKPLPGIQNYLDVFDGKEYDFIVERLTKIYTDTGLDKKNLFFVKLPHPDNYSAVRRIVV